MHKYTHANKRTHKDPNALTHMHAFKHTHTYTHRQTDTQTNTQSHSGSGRAFGFLNIKGILEP